MIGFIEGEVIFSDGQIAIVKNSAGVGFEVKFPELVKVNTKISLFTSHIIRENSQELFGHRNIRDKKVFELLLTVSGVGPRSAFSLLSFLGTETLVDAVLMERKELLKKAPGIGPKVSAQIILDLKDKIRGHLGVIKYDDSSSEMASGQNLKNNENFILQNESKMFLEDSLEACRQLGFGEEEVLPIALKILESNHINKSETLLSLILKEIR